MIKTTLFLPGFHLPTLRRKPRSASQKLAAQRDQIKKSNLTQMGEYFGSFIHHKATEQSSSGAFSRRRLFTKANSFWGFFSQVLDADGGCREVVRKIQAFAAKNHIKTPSSSTAAYCKARRKLEQTMLDEVLQQTSDELLKNDIGRSWHNRRVLVVDGTGLSMPDTEANQEVWPQSKNQKPGCGFPSARLCACFDLHTGGLVSYRMGNKKNHELPLLRQQWDTFQAGDIFLGDKGFCSYFDVAKFQERGVDSVITLARRTPVKDSEALEVLGTDDLLITWPKPKWRKSLSYSFQEWESLPEQLVLRQIKVTVDQPGYRVKQFYIVTTLTDAERYSVRDIAELYYRRWDVELFFRDIKTTLGMDILRCKSPEMIYKEITMHLIVYNSLRMLMLKASQKHASPLSQISVKASLQALRQWEPLIGAPEADKTGEKQRLMSLLYKAIAGATVPARPGRREPRCVKRRPKPYQLMSAPRASMVELEHRGKSRGKKL